MSNATIRTASIVVVRTSNIIPCDNCVAAPSYAERTSRAESSPPLLDRCCTIRRRCRCCGCRGRRPDLAAAAEDEAPPARSSSSSSSAGVAATVVDDDMMINIILARCLGKKGSVRFDARAER